MKVGNWLAIPLGITRTFFQSQEASMNLSSRMTTSFQVLKKAVELPAAICGSRKVQGGHGTRPEPTSRRCQGSEHRQPGDFETCTRFARLLPTGRKESYFRCRQCLPTSGLPVLQNAPDQPDLDQVHRILPSNAFIVNSLPHCSVDHPPIL